MSNLFKYEILIAGRWCEITDVELYEQVNADEKQYFRYPERKTTEKTRNLFTWSVRGWF